MPSQQSLPLNVDDLRLYHHYITVTTLTFEDDAMMESRSFASLHVPLATVRNPCTCTKLGKALDTPEPKNVDGYPLAGSDCTYRGLCSIACNYGHCPSEFCTTAASAKDKCVIPPEGADPEDSGDACAGGTGTGACSKANPYGGLFKEELRAYPQPRRGNAALMSNDDGEATQHFYTNETGEKWTRWIAQVYVCTQNRFHRRFKPPKGLDKIREKNDYGVTVENMILSPFFNWRRQGNQNYHPT
ncbi:hypothetical protein LZL87_012600 [Fusarium oxysporum]|nr:hypothetical protein LZL87_012600 [Fusarium oxysporum]